MIGRFLHKLTLATLLVLAGCDSPAPVDSGPPPMPDAGQVDASTIEDAGRDAGMDAGPLDGGPTDGGAFDGSVDASLEAGTGEAGLPDATVDGSAEDGGRPDAALLDAAVCHTQPIGSGSILIESADSLPTMTGGTIELGTYDAILVQTTGTVGVGGRYEGTWTFLTADQLLVSQVIDLGIGVPPPLTPRIFQWSTSAAELSRDEICPGTTDSFNNGYTVITDDPRGTILQVRSRSLLFTYLRRP